MTDNTGMETLQRAAVAVRNLIASDPEHNAWADWVPPYLDRLADSYPSVTSDDGEP